MTTRKIDCGGVAAKFCRDRRRPVSYFDRRSFRTTTRGKARIVIGCPKGQWNAHAKRCRVGTRAQTILRPLTHPKCRKACRRG